MTVDPEVINIGLWPHAGHHASRLDDEWVKWQADRASVDKVLARAGMFQGVEPRAVSALTAELHPVDFPSGHTVFVEGEPGDRLYIVISGKVIAGVIMRRPGSIGPSGAPRLGRTISVSARCSKPRSAVDNRREIRECRAFPALCRAMRITS